MTALLEDRRHDDAAKSSLGGRWRRRSTSPARCIWPEQTRCSCADLHLEKGSSFAARGMMLPPYDTRETLARAPTRCRALRPRTVDRPRRQLSRPRRAASGSAPRTARRSRSAAGRPRLDLGRPAITTAPCRDSIGGEVVARSSSAP